jgi:hypothetical protein
VLKSVPFESIAQTWGEEVYFEAPVSVSLEAGAQQTVDPGTVCYWVEGSSIALPYGARRSRARTASRSSSPRATWSAASSAIRGRWPK